MNLFSLAQRITEPNNQPPIELDANACLHARNRFSTCDACISICPVNALRLVPPITLDEKACVTCGACLPVCPVGALTGKDGADDLVRCVARLPDVRVLELACARHTAAEMGPAESTAVVRTDGCLAALGPSTFDWLLANETRRVIVRLDVCAGCSIGALQPLISRTVTAVAGLASVHGKAPSLPGEALPPQEELPPLQSESARVVEIRERDPNWKARVVVPVKNPPVSRRDMFRVFADEGPKLAARVVPFQAAKISEGKAPPLERRRLLNAIKRQSVSEMAGASISQDNGLGLVNLAASAKCTACAVCARVCPTGALRFVEQTASFRLTFAARACTDCGACLDLCEPGALTRDGVPTLGQLVSALPILLRTDALRTCNKCGAKFAGEDPGNLCPTCGFRVHNPFGSRQPARTLRQP